MVSSGVRHMTFLGAPLGIDTRRSYLITIPLHYDDG